MNCLFIMFVEEHSSYGTHSRFGNRTRSDKISADGSGSLLLYGNCKYDFLFLFVLSEHGLNLFLFD